MEEKPEEKRQIRDEDRIPTEALAAIIIDALFDADIIEKQDFQRALEIAMDKIDGRKQLGDY